ncbi:hypothetical protein [Bacillus sp. FSL K6-3431]|uniref:hypothetical protein n=1 Tax=Bacillus sp. FSL K6-3431 TaxID=2921500 RepID=UPI0030F82E35
MYNHNDVPIGGHIYWTTHNELDIEIFFNVYQTYTWVSASYYYRFDESIVGVGTQEIGRAGVKASLKIAKEVALDELFQELAKQRLTVWHTKRPDTNETATITFLAPERKRKN